MTKEDQKITPKSKQASKQPKNSTKHFASHKWICIYYGLSLTR